MARNPVTEDLHGHRYTATMLGTSQGFELIRRLGRVAGPALGTLLDGTDATTTLAKMMDDDAKDAMKKIAKSAEKNQTGLFKSLAEALVLGMEKSDTDWIIKTLRESSRVQIECQGNIIPLASIYEGHFQGEPLKHFEWIVFCLKAQLGLFSDGSDSAASSPADSPDPA